MKPESNLLTATVCRVLWVLVGIGCGVVEAQVPRKLNYQGYLTNATGTAINATPSMAFKFYTAAVGGSPLYSEIQTVTVANGVFDVVLGAAGMLNLAFDIPYYLGVAVEADSEMTPRQMVTASPYSLRAAAADGLAAGGPAGQLLAGTGGVPIWTGSPALSGNLTLPNSTAVAGNIMKGANRYIHNFGSSNNFIGLNAGNVTLTGNSNNAVGNDVLPSNSTGARNTAVGDTALFSNTTGSSNIGIGYFAGASLTTGSFNIDIGNPGVAGDSGTIRIGDTNHTKTFIGGVRTATVNNATPVLIDSSGQMGAFSSSRRYKDDIADMDTATAALMQLRPVTFHYKTDVDRALQYGLIAEEVAEIYPTLVAHSLDGQIDTVMYHYLPPMLLNEFQRQQRTLDSQALLVSLQAAELTQQLARIANLEHRLSALMSTLRSGGSHGK